MAGRKLKKLPYPPSPENVPEELTEYPATYRSQQNLLLAGLFIFLLFYLGLICLFALLGVYCFITMAHFFPIKLLGMILCGTFFLFLVKGFFKRHPLEKELHIEVTEQEQPILFEFIRKLIGELDAPEPNRVFVSLDVNAAVMPRTSLINLFKEPKKDLLIGLGLVNMLNLSEFKSVMAHEFGHFCQSAYASSYTYIAHRIIVDLIEGEDWFDRLIDWSKRQQNAFSIFGHVIGSILWVGRKLLTSMFKAIILQRMAVSREQEFHADLVAVKAAGSDAVPLSLLRLRFGNMCLAQAVEDLRTAAEHKLYTRDIFFHQEKSAPVVRRLRKDPKLGERPDIDGPMAGKTLRVFDPESESLEEEDIPEMRRSHPSFPESEENAKATFIPGPIDIRSPWILFTDVDELKERLTYKFYRMAMKIRKDTDLEDPIKVQTYIDNEHADTTYDPKYHGLYDDRPLEPGDLGELNELIRTSPWNEDRINKVLEKLYDGAQGKAEEYEELRKERATLDNSTGERGGRVKRLIEQVDKKLDKVWEWYKSLDRRVYLLHVQMAQAINMGWKEELVERYRFQLEVQKMYQEARHHQGKAYAFASALFNMAEPHPDFVAEVMQVLRQAWKALKNILRDAREVNLPAMKNFEEGERLADFILEGKLVSELPLTYVKGKWVGKLLDQLDMVRSRCFRLHFKSVGGILALQEKIAAEWKAQQAPVEAAVVEEAVPAEAVVAEAVEALPADGSGEQIYQNDRYTVAVVQHLPPGPVPAKAVAESTPAEVVPEVIEAEVLDATVVEEPAPAMSVPVVAAPVAPAAPPKPPTPAVVAPPPPRVEPPPPVVVAPPPPPVPIVEPEPPAPEPVAEAPVADAPGSPDSAAVAPASGPSRPRPLSRLGGRDTPGSPEPKPEPQPAPPAPEPKLTGEPVADIFTLDAATPAPVEPVGSGIVDLAAPTARVEAVVQDIFSLDADAQPAAVAPKSLSPPPAPAPVTADEIFSLDADDLKPAPQAPAQPASVEFLSLDADDQPSLPSPVPRGPSSVPPPASVGIPAGPGEPAMAARVHPAAPAKPVVPAAKPAAPIAEPTSVTKPAKNGRPAIRITFVRPGQKSPLS